MLNHFTCVGLKRHYFSICFRGTTFTAFRCAPLLKKRPQGKVEEILFMIEGRKRNFDSKHVSFTI